MQEGDVRLYLKENKKCKTVWRAETDPPGWGVKGEGKQVGKARKRKCLYFGPQLQSEIM